MEQDIEKLLSAGCDILFLPPKEEIYPVSFVPKQYELGELENVLEGLYRPGHYQGVCQVVDRLLEIVSPQNIYLGAKDYQQCKVIAKLLQLLGKEDDISIHIEPTLREPDGLAMSSRNLRLAPEQREAAPIIFEVLKTIKANHDQVDTSQLISAGAAELEAKGFVIDYLQIADAGSLLPASAETKNKIVLVAASIGNIRLIDNLLLN
jgi:pantoate--beta-alanine ligase